MGGTGRHDPKGRGKTLFSDLVLPDPWSHSVQQDRWHNSLPCCSGSCFSLPLAMPKTPAMLGFCTRETGKLSREPLRFSPEHGKKSQHTTG